MPNVPRQRKILAPHSDQLFYNKLYIDLKSKQLNQLTDRLIRLGKKVIDDRSILFERVAARSVAASKRSATAFGMRIDKLAEAMFAPPALATADYPPSDERDEEVANKWAKSSGAKSLDPLIAAARAESVMLAWIDRLHKKQPLDISREKIFSIHDAEVQIGDRLFLLDAKNVSHDKPNSLKITHLERAKLKNIVFVGMNVKISKNHPSVILGQLSSLDIEEIASASKKLRRLHFNYDSIESVLMENIACLWLFSYDGDLIGDPHAETRASIRDFTKAFDALEDLDTSSVSFPVSKPVTRFVVGSKAANRLHCEASAEKLQDYFHIRLADFDAKSPRLFYIYLLTLEHFLDELLSCPASPSHRPSFPPYRDAIAGPTRQMPAGCWDPSETYSRLLDGLKIIWDYVGPEKLQIEQLSITMKGTLVANTHKHYDDKFFPRQVLYAHCRHCGSELVYRGNNAKEGGLDCKYCFTVD